MKPCIERGCPELVAKGNRCPAHSRANTRRRKAQGLTGKRGSTGAWRRIRASVIRRQGNRCWECGAIAPLEVDHIDNDSTNNDPSNLQALCVPCHHDKHR